jgi:diguanylate cyclase (GGDEF)-like protein/PAS domain S-box-containing protein
MLGHALGVAGIEVTFTGSVAAGDSVRLSWQSDANAVAEAASLDNPVLVDGVVIGGVAMSPGDSSVDEHVLRRLVLRLADIVGEAERRERQLVPSSVDRVLLSGRFEDAIDPFLAVHSDTGRGRANAALRGLLGATNADLSPNTVSELLGDAREMPAHQNYRHRIRMADGSWCEVLVSGGRPVGWLSAPSLSLHRVLDASDLARAEARMRRFLRLSGVVLESSAAFSEATADTLDTTVERALERLGSSLGADRASLVRLDLPADRFITPSVWCSEAGIRQLKGVDRNKPSQIPMLTAELSALRTIMITNVDELGESWNVDAECFRSAGIQSLVAVPLVVAGRPAGAIRLDVLRRPRVWDDEEIGALSIVGEIVVNTIERLETEVQLRSSREQFRALVEHSTDLILTVGRDGWIRYASPASLALLGRPPDLLIGQSLAVLASDDFSAAQLRRIATTQTGPATIELRVVRPDGSMNWVELRWSALRTSDSAEPTELQAVCRDVTARRRAEEELRRQALADRLTGMMNRAGILGLLAEVLIECAASNESVSVLFVDLDGFKPVNDKLGHEAGDTVLTTVADRIRHAVRPGDAVGRLGGDEFVIVCRGLADDAAARQVGERVVAASHEPVIVGSDAVAQVGASVGAVIVRGSTWTPETVVAEADAAMYAAKRAGKGRVHVIDRTR